MWMEGGNRRRIDKEKGREGKEEYSEVNSIG
jgi:hypothetical protein